MKIKNLKFTPDGRRVELRNSLFKPYKPESHTGIFVTLPGCWTWNDENGNEYATDHSAEGLWVNGKQSTGTCQFSLPKDGNKKRAYRIIHREFNETIKEAK